MTVPAACWTWPGFKACHEEAGHKAYRLCQTMSVEGSEDFQKCHAWVLEEYTLECIRTLGCGLPTASASSTAAAVMAALPWSVYSEQTKVVQQEANKILPALSRPALVVDGKLGPATCAAIATIVQSGRGSGWVVPASCTSAGAATAIPGYPVPGSDPYAAYADPSAGRKWALLAGSALLAGGAYYLWKSRRTRK
jgi:hypothetical protein